MIKYKDFLLRLCEVEKVSIKELQEITNKSKTVVYEWFNFQNKTSFPRFEELSKILCRLGVTIDEFIRCKSSKVLDYQLYRSYNEYIRGSFTSQYISESILENENYYEILNSYVEDCYDLRAIINDFLEGIEIDKEEFEKLSKLIGPVYFSDVTFLDDYSDGVTGYLSYGGLIDFKMRNDLFKELIEDDEEEKDAHEHGIFFPSASCVIFKAASKKLRILRKYLSILNNIEKNALMETYIRMYLEDNSFDSEKRIFKFLVSNDCTLNYVRNETITNAYRNLLDDLSNTTDLTSKN